MDSAYKFEMSKNMYLFFSSFSFTIVLASFNFIILKNPSTKKLLVMAMIKISPRVYAEIEFLSTRNRINSSVVEEVISTKVAIIPIKRGLL
ncbi:hypothetical protein CLOSBL3_11040 [Clostridiaceae bacterium BL-3]|nr:hypothetical protein CLOSBL3_11040 [Clostridiaceae bacterium BL-3]